MMQEEEYWTRSNFPLSINPSTRAYQLYAEEARKRGFRGGSHEWWNCIRELRAEDRKHESNLAASRLRTGV